VDVVVRAAGGVVWRSTDGVVEVVLIRRLRYDDWTFPKGKREPGESDEHCALREVEEETGLRCTLGREMPATSYVDARGRQKVVRWWEMTVAEARPWAPDDEVDEVAWVDVDAAERLLTYGRDVEVLDDFARWAGER
jgi:8-oxo-dGTP diphosphatase